MSWSLPSASGNDDPNANVLSLLAFLPKRALRGSEEPEPEENLEAEPEEEYYAKQARIAKRLGLSNDNRTGRRTRNRSGPPGPPSVRVPFNEKEFMRNRKPENRPLISPKPARLFSKFVFGGDPPPPPRDTPNLVDASGTGSESGQPDLVPQPTQPVFKFLYQDIRHKGKVAKDRNVKLETEQIGQANQDMDYRGASSNNNCLKPPDSSDKQDNDVAKLDDRPLERHVPWYSHFADVKEIKEVWDPLEFTYANKVKVKLASMVVCFECKESCGFPGFSCVNGHPICQVCQRKCSVLDNVLHYCEESTPFSCPGCAVVDVRREMSGVNKMLEQLKFTCYCGQIVRGTKAGEHLKCDALKHRPQKVLVCESFGANICEFCNQQVIYRKYVDHLIREHFERKFLPLSNEDLIKMPKAEPLFQREFALPLQGQEALGVRSSVASRIVAAPDFGKFTLYQMSVEKELTWYLSFERNPTVMAELSTSQFHAKLKFEVVVENRLYRKICHALVYPLANRMDEKIFLELVRMSLPDAWLTRFKFASTHATTLNIQIYRSNEKYVRRCGRIFQVEM